MVLFKLVSFVFFFFFFESLKGFNLGVFIRAISRFLAMAVCPGSFKGFRVRWTLSLAMACA